MESSLYIAKKIECNLSKLDSTQQNYTVSFSINVLDKYQSTPVYEINLNENVGILKSKKEGWSLQIDVCDYYVNTWL